MIIKPGYSITLHPESRTSTISAPKGALYEVVSRRQASQKCWQTANGKQIVYCWNKYAPVHYLDNYNLYMEKTENWKEVDPTYYEDIGDYLLFNRMPHTVKVFKNKYGYEITDRQTMKTMSVELLEIDDEPVDLSAKIARVSFDVEVKHNGVRFWKETVENGPTKFKWQVKESGNGQSHLKFREAPEAFDREQKEIVVSVTKTPTKEGFIWTEQVNKTGVKIDTDIIGGTSDGRIYGRSTSITNARFESYNCSTADSAEDVGQYLSGYYYCVARLFYDFYTSNISTPFSRVNLKLTCQAVNKNIDFDIQIVKQSWNEALCSYRETNYDGCLNGTADDSILCNTDGMSANTAYTSGNLDTSYINTSGDTKYSLRSSRDKSGNTPTDFEQVYFYSANASTASYRPVLIITYGWSGKIWGVTNPAKIWGIPVANIAKIGGI